MQKSEKRAGGANFTVAQIFFSVTVLENHRIVYSIRAQKLNTRTRDQSLQDIPLQENI